jgi:hypothetical protein
MSTNENDSKDTKEPGPLVALAKSSEAKKYYWDLACGITKAVAITAAAVITANLVSNAFASDDEGETEDESESESSDDIIDE